MATTAIRERRIAIRERRIAATHQYNGAAPTRRVSGVRRWRDATICVAAVACALGAVSPASASTLAVDAGGALRFNAARGEVNNVNATDQGAGGGTVVTDPGSIISVGSGCVEVTPHEAQCAGSPLDAQDVVVDLADGDDSARWFKVGFGRIRIAGGAGDDTIVDAPESGAEVSGGPGGDTITVAPNGFGRVDVNGGAGHDSITASGSGVVDGGAGPDEITLNNFVDGGVASAARGGPGDDTISAKTVGMSLIEGGVGDDAITASESATVSVIDGGPGADTVTSGSGSSEINGGVGSDVIDGGGGGDRINCGLGIDHYVVYEGDTVRSCEIPFTPDVPSIGVTEPERAIDG